MSWWSSIGCQRNPFSSRFDAQSYYRRPSQESSFRQLFVRISSGQGPLLVTGEAGTGKTALLNRLNAELQAAGALTIFLARPAPTLDMLLSVCLGQVGLQQGSREACDDKMDTLKDFLGRLETGRVACLLVDEAQSMSDEVLKALLELSAPDEQGRSLIPAVLAGHSTLETRVAGEAFAQLAGFIDFRYRLPPMDQKEVASFIHHRLRSAGCPETVFSQAAIDRVFANSGGLPASVKNLCSLALFLPDDDERTQVTAGMVEAAASAMMLQEELPELPHSTADEEEVEADKAQEQETEDWIPILERVALTGTNGGQSEVFSAAQGAVSPEDQSARLDKKKMTAEDTAVQPSVGIGRPGLSSEPVGTPVTEPVQGNIPPEAVEGEAISRPSDHRETERAEGVAAEEATAAENGDGIRSALGSHWALAAGVAVMIVAAGLTWIWYDPQLLGFQNILSSAGDPIEGENKTLSAKVGDSQPGSTFSMEAPVLVADRSSGDGYRTADSVARIAQAGKSLTPVDESDLTTQVSPGASVHNARAVTNRDDERGDAAEVSARVGPVPATPPASPPASPSDLTAPLSPTGRGELLTEVKLRERPTVRSRLVAILKKGDNAMLVSHLTGSNWYRLQTITGLEGFAYASLVPKPSVNEAAQSGALQPGVGLLQLNEAEAGSAEVLYLLALAEEHMQADRLMAPRFDNALAVFRKVLRVEPRNETALAGIERIKAKLLAFARDAAADGDLETARRQINKVLVIEANDEGALAALAGLEARQSGTSLQRRSR